MLVSIADHHGQKKLISAERLVGYAEQVVNIRHFTMITRTRLVAPLLDRVVAARRREVAAGAVRRIASLWCRATAWLAPTARAADDFIELAELDSHTLRDIAAPEHLLAAAHGRAEAQCDARDALREGRDAGGWRSW